MKRVILLSLFFVIYTLSSFADDNDELLKTLNPGPKPKYTITVSQLDKEIGKITLELFPEVAPKHCRNFDSLVAIKFYDGTKFHRIIPSFVIQGGGYNSKIDSNKKKWGVSHSSQTRLPAEFSKLLHIKGYVSMPRKGNDLNSGTSQMFICLGEASDLDGQYTVFGRVTQGIETVEAIEKVPVVEGDYPLNDITMTVVKNN